ncbi:hypothetical protein N9888_02225 [Akkermansiaceae bacterium]|nr:hypothetical protein [Akkermansiaceae bacterium]
MKIALIHYHLRAGGVTRVIESQARVLEGMGHEVFIPQGLPLLDYCRKTKARAMDLLAEIDYEILEKVDLWIIHNPVLGKNVLFPDLIEALARRGERLLLQCHDFAEDGRPSNYEILRDRGNLYPLAEHIHYAFINERDRRLLIEAGVPEERCHALPNALNPITIKPGESEGTLVFYPVRGIRRKNLGELCLWAAHAPKGVRFAIARAPENPEWMAVHNDWRRFAEEMDLPIEFDVVDSPDDFKSWLERASHIATTSVAEGFGLTFMEPHLINKPLIGRDLPDITADFKKQGLSLGLTYEKISVPLELLNQNALRRDFAMSLEKTFLAYGKSPDVELAWEKFISKGEVDFGNLPEKHQREFIQKRHLPELHRWLIEALKTRKAQPQDISHWSLEAYQKRISKVIQQISESEISPVNHLDKERVLKSFLHPDRFHFLRT